VNDEVPQFQNVPRPFLAMVSSDAPLGTSVYQLVANDHDHNSLVQYSLESGKHIRNCFRFYFYINQSLIVPRMYCFLVSLYFVSLRFSNL